MSEGEVDDLVAILQGEIQIKDLVEDPEQSMKPFPAPHRAN